MKAAIMRWGIRDHECLVMAGVGGLMPTLAKLGATYVTAPDTPMPAVGLYVGLFIFFIIGVAVCHALGEKNPRQAFVIGICAPGIITNIVAGYDDARGAAIAAAAQNANSFLISSAFADDRKQGEIAYISSSEQRAKISFHVRGPGTVRERDLRIGVYFRLNDGSIRPVYQTSPLVGLVTLDIPQEALAIGFEAGGKQAETKLPPQPFDTVFVDVVVNTRGVFDLWAALGGSKMPQVTSIEAASIVAYVDPPPGEAEPTVAHKAEPTAAPADHPLYGMRADDIIGSNIVNEQGENIGSVGDLVLDMQGESIYALVEVGGFLGIGAREVALPLDDMELTADDELLLRGVTQEQLEKMPEYEEGQFAAVERDQPISEQARQPGAQLPPTQQ